MFGSRLHAFVGAEPTESELARIGVLAGVLAVVASAIGTLGHDGGLRQYIPILALVVLVTLAVFAWAVPSALNLDESGPSAVALMLSGLGVLTLLLFWTGLPLVLGAGGIVLGRTQLDFPEDRRLALAAVRVGAASIALFLVVFAADLV